MALTLEQILAKQGGKKSLTLQEIVALNNTPPKQPLPPKSSLSGTLLTPLTQGIGGLADLYSGSKTSIGSKLINNVEEGAKDIQKGMQIGGLAGVPSALKGITKVGLRSAGDVAGAVYAPIGAAIGATGIGGVFNKIAEAKPSQGSIIDRITDIPAVQNFVSERPNLEEDFTRALNLYFAAKETGKIEPRTVVPRTVNQIKAVGTTVGSVASKLNPLNVRENLGIAAEKQVVKDIDNLFKSNKTITRRSAEAENRGVPLKETFSDPAVYDGLKVENGRINATKAIETLDTRIENLLNAKRAMLPEIDRLVPAVDKSMVRNNAVANIQGKYLLENEKLLIKAIDDQLAPYPDKLPPSVIDDIRAKARAEARNAQGLQKSSSEYAALENGARKTIFDVTDNLPVSNAKEFTTLNVYVKDMIIAKTFAENVLNGQAVKGGRLGGYLGRAIGATALSGYGVFATLAGAEIGGLITNILTNNQLGSSMKMVLIRNLTDNPAVLLQAEKLLGGLKNTQPLQLPAPTSQFKTQVGSGKTIELGPKTQSSIDTQEMLNISRQNTAKSMTATTPKNDIGTSIPANVNPVKPTITIGGKTIDLDFIHSSAGTKFFESLSKADQVKLATWDHVQSRPK